MASTIVLFLGAGPAIGQAPLARDIENPSGKYLVWGDYKIELNQYGGLGRNWPTPDLFWEQYEILKRRARANPDPPNTLRAVLLVFPSTEATAVRDEDGKEVVVATKVTSMTSSEVKDALDQWRKFEEMVHVFSGGNAWLRTDIKVIDEPLRVRTDENWGFWAGQHREHLERYIPFRRGDYQSYNALYNSKGLNAGPHGGTMGAVGGIKGCGTSDNAVYSSGPDLDERTGYVALHEWLNQQCSATSNMMPYPDGETLWNNYVLSKIGYREDRKLNAWPWISLRRDTMTGIIRPGMWKRWTAIDPYESPAIGRWILFGPLGKDLAREATTKSAADGVLLETKMERYTHFDIARASASPKPVIAEGTYYLRTYVESDATREVRLWAAADERFQVWLNGVMIRDGWGWNYSDDDGMLIEKVAYPVLRKGINTLVLVVPNADPERTGKVEFRLRFARTDGSGRQPEGVAAFPALGDKVPLPLEEPVVRDFVRPALFRWADISDMPWTKMPRLGEAELRAITGIEALAIRTDGAPRTGEDGQSHVPPQHLFLDVPRDSVASTWIPAPAEDSAKLDNDLDFNWKSMAWLRMPGRKGPEKDLALVRFDVAEPILHLLKTRGRPAAESIVGWVLVEHKLAYAALVDLDIDGPPETAVGLLRVRPE